jgi:hypothetical protein
LKRKTKLTKRPKREKKGIRIKIEIKKWKQIFLLKGEIKKKNQFNKRTQKKEQLKE